MRNILFLGFCLLASGALAQSGVAIGGSGATPHSSAILDVQSTAKGVLIPSMTSAQRTAISNPANGLLVFDNTTGGFWFYSGGWTELVHNNNESWERDTDTISARKPFVGIGTTNPGRMLTLGFNNANVNTSHMLIEQSGSGDAWFNIGLKAGKHYAIGVDNSDADKFKIGYNATGPGSLHVNTRLTIDTLGHVGIGTSSPANRLQVNALTAQSPFRADIAGVTRFQVHSNGGASVGAATVPPANGLHVTGAITPAGGISASGNIVITSTAGYVSVNAGGSEIRIYANGQIDIDASASLNITAAGNLDITAAGDLSLNGNNVTIYAANAGNLVSGVTTNIGSGNSTTINSAGNMEIDASGALDILSGNTMDILNSTGTMNVRNNGGTLNVSATSTLNLDGALVDLNNGTNGAARVGDAVSGVILTGSSTVRIGN